MGRKDKSVCSSLKQTCCTEASLKEYATGFKKWLKQTSKTLWTLNRIPTIAGVIMGNLSVQTCGGAAKKDDKKDDKKKDDKKNDTKKDDKKKDTKKDDKKKDEKKDDKKKDEKKDEKKDDKKKPDTGKDVDIFAWKMDEKIGETNANDSWD